MIDLDRIKQTVDLVELIRSRGVELTKNGKGYKGLCPFHEDQDPSFSVNPDKNLWHCFGCDKGGDAIRFVELYDQVDFKSRAATGTLPCRRCPPCRPRKESS
jgi:DNA primase